MISTRMLGGTVLAIAVVGFAVTGCGDDAAKTDCLLALDGIEIKLADVEPYVAFFDSFLPEGGRKTKIQRVLDDFLIPLRLAQRAFPAERQAQRVRADALRSVASNVQELERQTELMKDKRRSNMTRTHAHIPVAMYLFDSLQVGGVSQPIELPTGWFVVAAYDLIESPGLKIDDYVDALQVGFVTHTSGEFVAWYEAQKKALGTKCTFVHPDYRTAMPPWIQPPKQP